MSRGGRLAERLARIARQAPLGRERELEWLLSQTKPAGAVLTFVHGLGGIGKTSLLDALEARLELSKLRGVRLDGRTLEPTARGFLRGVEETLATPVPSVEALAELVEREPGTTVFLVDESDRLTLLDGWLRRTLMPALPERTRWICAGRFAPHPAWLTTPGWSESVEVLRLGPLDETASRALLARRGVPAESVPALLELARGNPLALELVARSARGAEPGPQVNESAVLAALAERWVDGLSNETREAVVAASVLRRVTRPLLTAMLPEAREPFEDLRALPFMDFADDGLVMHESVKQAVVTRLRASDPERYRQLRRAAWSVLREEMAVTLPSGPDAWRVTADVLYIVDHPEVREAFFPSAQGAIAIDAANETDWPELERIARRHAAPFAETLASWWTLCRESFQVAKDRTGAVIGFGIVARSERIGEALERADPLVAAWQRRLREGPGRDRGALFMRCALSAEQGEAASDVKGALWLDIKRAYVERPAQWALYVATRHFDQQRPLFETFGFQAVDVAVGEERTVVLEFGASGIWSWLRRLADVTHRPDPPSEPRSGFCLDEGSRALVVDGRAVALSPLEYGVLKELTQAGGDVVTRDVLLERVWKQRHTGSNVVDALVRLLRRKLEPYASALETVKGHGYRLRSNGASESSLG